MTAPGISDTALPDPTVIDAAQSATTTTLLGIISDRGLDFVWQYPGTTVRTLLVAAWPHIAAEVAAAPPATPPQPHDDTDEDAFYAWLDDRQELLGEDTLSDERSAFYAGIKRGLAAGRADSADTERQRWHDALADAIEGMKDMIDYVPEFFREKWDHQGYLDRATGNLALLDDTSQDKEKT
jgi:hypothetical protein